MACKNSAFFVEWKARKSEVLGSMFKKKRIQVFFRLTPATKKEITVFFPGPCLQLTIFRTLFTQTMLSTTIILAVFRTLVLLEPTYRDLALAQWKSIGRGIRRSMRGNNTLWAIKQVKYRKDWTSVLRFGGDPLVSAGGGGRDMNKIQKPSCHRLYTTWHGGGRSALSFVVLRN